MWFEGLEIFLGGPYVRLPERRGLTYVIPAAVYDTVLVQRHARRTNVLMPQSLYPLGSLWKACARKSVFNKPVRLTKAISLNPKP